MDHQHRGGHKTGSGALASSQDIAIERRERLRRLALETIDLSKDPYFMKNHLGQIECRLCLTIHTNEASYLSHTQARRHQTNLIYRAAKEKSGKSSKLTSDQIDLSNKKPKTPRIGIPKYQVSKHWDSKNNQKCIYAKFFFPDIKEKYKPYFRIMSCWEQKKELPDTKYQYLLIAAEPYNVVAIKIPNYEIERKNNKLMTFWDNKQMIYHIQIFFQEKIKDITDTETSTKEN
ncbi:hypothetical protein cand_027040 [Cryptosporidium andersoni]|uniref:Uncharacterized protein n=1 Tax=Cryptosporidium andersoni TaxID=117008 RepID=A0A1J4MU18_9CRYT|nr:hypothetical protein cand_027040 [Cryptosporidium andersoni]